MSLKKNVLLIVLLSCNAAFGQLKIGNNPTTINSNSALEIESTTKGILIPRLPLVATNNNSPMSAFVAGMTVYNTATSGSGTTAVTPGFYYSDGTQWVRLLAGTDGATNIYSTNGSLSGNRTITQGANTLAFTSTATNGFSVDGTTLSVDAANDRIGIGTSTPTSTLDVRGYGVFGTGSSGLALGQAGYTDIYAFGTGNRLTMNYGRDVSTDINFASNADVTIVTGGTGKLGVGSFPTEKLDVNGNVKFSGALMPNNSAGTSGQVLVSSGTGAAPIWSDVTNWSANNIYNTNGSLSGNRTVTQGANTLAFTSTATNGFSVDGTTFSVDAANNRVGIGTATPNAQLQFSNSIGKKITMFETVANDHQIYGFGIDSYILKYQVDGSSANHVFYAGSSATTSTELMRITGTGNVGIGTSSPVEKLHVAGNIRASSLAGSGSRMVVADANGTMSTSAIPTSTTYTGSTSVTLNGTSFERAALTGDVTATANSNSLTIANNAVTYSKIQTVSGNNKLLGRATTGAGTVEEISLGTGLSLSGSTLNAASATTLYNGDGSLSGNRTVTQGANTLAFTSTATNGFSVDGTTLSVDAANDRIGIGTSTPTSTLDVRGYGVFSGGSSGIAIGQAGYSDIHAFGTGNRLTFNYGSDVSTDINFASNADVTIVTGGTGKLGVGSFPTEKLDVNGNVKFSGALMPNNTAGTAGQVLTSAGAGAVPTWTTISAGTTYTGSTSNILN